MYIRDRESWQTGVKLAIEDRAAKEIALPRSKTIPTWITYDRDRNFTPRTLLPRTNRIVSTF